MCEHDGSDGKLHVDDDVDVPAALKRTSVHCGEVTQAKLDLDHEQGDVELRGDDEEGTQEGVAPITGPGMVDDTFGSTYKKTMIHSLN